MKFSDMHKSQMLFYLLLAFIVGVFTGSFWIISYSQILALLIGGISIMAVFSYRKTLSKSKNAALNRKIGILIGFIIVSFTFGIVHFNGFNYENSILSGISKSFLKDSKGRETGTQIHLQGYVGGEPETAGSRTKFVFNARRVIIGNRTFDLKERTLVTTDSFPVYKFGDQLLLIGVLKEPQNFDEFDYVTYLKKEGVRTTMSFPLIADDTGKIDYGRFEKVKINLYRGIFNVKKIFQDAINKSVSEPVASYASGILLGSRQNIPAELKEAFNKTSTTHILAISGFNIMIISEAILIILTFFVRRRAAFWISVAVIVLFTILTGASSSVVRAAVMGLLILFAHGYGKLYDVKNSIILAGAIMIYINPFVLSFDIGFQLSFLAVLGLVYLYPLLNYKLKRLPKLGGLKEIALMTVSAQMMVLPLLIYYFKTISLVSLPTNILILPFVPYAMLAGFIAGVGGMIAPFLGQTFGFIVWAIGIYQIRAVEFFASLNFASIPVSINLPVLAVVYSAIFFLLHKTENKYRISTTDL